MSDNIKILATNKKAYHDYFIEDTYETGIVLIGCEVKSIRKGQINLKESYVRIKNDEVILIGAHISPYEHGSFSNVDPRRDRKVLLNKSEIRKLKIKVEQKGYTLIATKVYLKGSLVKLEVAVCRGKELHDKRETIAKKDAKREIDRAIKTRIKNN